MILLTISTSYFAGKNLGSRGSRACNCKKRSVKFSHTRLTPGATSLGIAKYHILKNCENEGGGGGGGGGNCEYRAEAKKIISKLNEPRSRFN